MTAFLTRVPCLDDGSTALGQAGDNLCSTAEHHEYHWFAGSYQFLDVLFLLAGQAQPLAVAVLATQHHVLAHGSNDDVGTVSHGKGFSLVGLLAGINLTV